MTDRWIFKTTATDYDERVSYGPGEFEFAHLRLPKRAGPHPLIIYLHGGFWRAAVSLNYAEHMCAALTELGYATYNVEYPRTGQIGGGWPGTFRAVGAATDYLRGLAGRFSLDLSRTIAMGHSVGGLMALWLAGRLYLPSDDPLYGGQPLPLRGAISLAGLTDLPRSYELGLGERATEAFMGGSPLERPAEYRAASPLEHLPLGLPQLLIHGDQDVRVPFDFSQTYYDRALSLGDPVTLLKLPGVGHFEPVDPHESVWPLILQNVAAFMEQMG